VTHVGEVVALPPAFLVACAITVIAMKRHSPVRDPTRLHRDIWWSIPMAPERVANRRQGDVSQRPHVTGSDCRA